MGTSCARFKEHSIYARIFYLLLGNLLQTNYIQKEDNIFQGKKKKKKVNSVIHQWNDLWSDRGHSIQIALC